jgi:hypothetical protein
MAFWSLERLRRRAATTRSHLPNVVLALQAGLVSYSVSAFFLSAWWTKMFWLLVFLTMCLDRSCLGRPDDADRIEDQSGPTEIEVSTGTPQYS